MAHTKVTNVSDGPRGIWTIHGLAMIDRGQSDELELAKGEEEGEWFKFGAQAAKKAAEASDDKAA